MPGEPILFDVAYAGAPERDVRRRLGPPDAPWRMLVLNGQGRRYHAKSQGGAFSIKWMASARARYVLERRSRTISGAAAVLVDHDQPYEMEFEAPGGGESFCLFFHRSLLAEAWASAEAGFDEVAQGTPRGFPNVVFTPSLRLGSLLGALHADGPDADPALIENRLLLCLEEAVATARRHRGEAARIPAAKDATRSHLLHLVERARLRLVEARGVGIDLAALASEAGLSRFHLLRLFKAVHGVTPIAFAERLRMEAGARALRSGGAPIGEVAAALGYDSPSAFARAFRRRLGVAPSVWRE